MQTVSEGRVDKKGDLNMWQIIAIVMMIAAVIAVMYLAAVVGKSAVLNRFIDRAWLRVLISLGLIAGGFLILYKCMSFVNALIILIHVFVFTIIYGIGIRVFRYYTHIDFKINYQIILALATTVIYFGIAYFLCVNVWKTEYAINTSKKLGELRIAMLADSHIGTTFDGEGFAKHIEEIDKQGADILFIVGDFVDDASKKDDLIKTCEVLSKTNFKYGVWFVFGNHDRGYGQTRDFSEENLREILTEYGIHILEDEYELIDDKFYVVGRKDATIGPRLSMAELVKDIDRDKYVIVLDHEPSDYDNEAGLADLVLSGHSHGGQIIPIKYTEVWTGLLDRAYGYENRKGTDFIVTSGISDWELLFKTGTKSEYVIINVR